MKTYFNYIISRIFLVITIFGIALSACVDKPMSYKPRAIGSPGELLVVIDDIDWNSESGDLLKLLLEDEFPALPQQETLFRKTRIAFEQFVRHFRTYRNILIVSVNGNESSNRIEYRKKEWAQNQNVVNVIAKNHDDLNALLRQKWSVIKGFFYDGDIQSMANSYRGSYESEAVDFILNSYPFSLYLPKGYKLKKEENGFSWLESERRGSHLGVFLYKCSLDSLTKLDADNLLNFRNKILQEQVPGENEGSFMTTEDKFPVTVANVKFAGQQWIELRGLWKVQGDFMGGPFVDYFLAEKDNNQLLMLSGYVYAPARPKKGIYMREVEAVLKTYRVN